MQKPFFKADPSIRWTKTLCPICGSVTGNKSECYNLLSEDDNPKHRRTLNHPQLGLLPLFSENCVFRQENQWQAEINYPVSNLLLTQIKQIKGLERVYPLKTYTFQVSIGNLFDEKIVKSEINAVFKAFIKEMQVDESQLFVETNNDPMIIGVILPNGKETRVVNDSLEDKRQQSLIFQNILDEFPDAKPIFETKIVESPKKTV